MIREPSGRVARATKTNDSLPVFVVMRPMGRMVITSGRLACRRGSRAPSPALVVTTPLPAVAKQFLGITKRNKPRPSLTAFSCGEDGSKSRRADLAFSDASKRLRPSWAAPSDASRHAGSVCRNPIASWTLAPEGSRSSAIMDRAGRSLGLLAGWLFAVWQASCAQTLRIRPKTIICRSAFALEHSMCSIT